jgi:D-3-phosphoglycerate dehydrogenase
MRAVKDGRWERRTGIELAGKTLGVVGLGRIGREVVKRADAFDMTCLGFGHHWDDEFAGRYRLERSPTREDLLRRADVVTLHTNLTPETRGMIDARALALMKDGAILINTARGGLVVEDDVAAACRGGKLRGYGADVLEAEPIRPPHPFQGVDSIVVTPHIGSRTQESVQRQGVRAAKNLVNFLNGDPDYIQANRF